MLLRHTLLFQNSHKLIANNKSTFTNVCVSIYYLQSNKMKKVYLISLTRLPETIMIAADNMVTKFLLMIKHNRAI